MSPGVEAALIAGGVGFVTLIGTLVVQFYGIHRTSSDTEKTLKQQSEQLGKTLADQREQLDRTLAQQGEQLDRTLAQQRDRTLNERFATAADRLGSDKPPAVRLAGVHAMAGLADDWPENRQTCVDVLCAYLRLPYYPDPGHDAAPEQAAYRANREVRHTIIRLIAAHLRADAQPSWEGLNLDFTGVVFDGGNFADVRFSRGMVRFESASFSSGLILFEDAEFSGGEISFSGAEFSGAKVDFGGTEFSGTVVDFGAKFSGGEVNFSAMFCDGVVDFADAEFSGAQVYFSSAALFLGGAVDFSNPRDWSHPPHFDWENPPAGVTLPADADAKQG